MAGLDIIGLDSDLDGAVDCEPVAGPGGPVERSAAGDSHTAVEFAGLRRGQPAFAVWRYFVNGHDVALTDLMKVDIARAVGTGPFAVTGHDAVRSDIRTVTIDPCDALLPYLPAPPPEAWLCPFLRRCTLYRPGPPENPAACSCGLCDAGYEAVLNGTRCVPWGSAFEPNATAPPVPAVGGDWGCPFIAQCALYEPPEAPSNCTCGKCYDGAVLSDDARACVGDAGPFGCRLIDGCDLYVPSPSRNASDCPCGLCLPGRRPSDNERSCLVAPTAAPSTAAPSTAAPSTAAPPTGGPTTGTAEPSADEPLATGVPAGVAPTPGPSAPAAPITWRPATGLPPTGRPGAPALQPVTADGRGAGENDEELLPVGVWGAVTGALFCACGVMAAMYCRAARAGPPAPWIKTLDDAPAPPSPLAPGAAELALTLTSCHPSAFDDPLGPLTATVNSAHAVPFVDEAGRGRPAATPPVPVRLQTPLAQGEPQRLRVLTVGGGRRVTVTAGHEAEI
eukprot:TRINITY_DN5299_c0_g4_i1.p1 TRINITY_DN5299_c0_g4~~TRINITY_DN5299_c0_g4_i1.p1  ORF type:complete len:580 (+),score=120.81 TRINITY_DN5299_c0_g4_i1:224-1741(+)